MFTILKMFIFPLILLMTFLAGWWCYKELNRRIIKSNSLTAVLGYSLLLIAANIVLIFGAVYLLVNVYGILYPDQP